MRFRLVTVAILLAIASKGDGRPRDPDPMDVSRPEGGSPDNSRYTSHPRRRVISINKFPRSRAMIPGLSFESENSRKNYLPLGALSARSFAYPTRPPTTSPQPIPLGRSFSSSRKMDSRTLVRIVPQKLKPGFNSRRNLTSSKFKDSLASLHLKNWPNEAVQSVQDLLNYEKYTTFHEDSAEISKPKVTINRQPTTTTLRPSWTRIPATETTTLKPSWTRIPVTETTTLPTTRFDYETTMTIDSLLDDLAKNKRLPQTSSEVMQNTVVHILNAGSKKPNITVDEPSSVKKVNKVKPGGKRPPQNVHIMFMVDKDEGGNQTLQSKPPTEVLGGDSDCPTIMINSITQINNTIESKEGCTDLNIVINSHVLNTNIVKPSASTAGGQNEGLKNPYNTQTTSYPNTYYPNTNYPSNTYPTSSYPSSNYNELKDPAAQADAPQIQTFEVFQGTHINIGGSQPDVDFPEGGGIVGGDEPAAAGVDGEPLADAEQGTNDIAESAPGPAAEGGESIVGEQFAPGGVANEVGTGEAIDSPAESILPGLPSLPNVPNLPNLPSLPGNGGQTGITAPEADEEDEVDELIDAVSPVTLFESISNVFSSFALLNPLNYGIFGFAVAPFVAFAAGILGVATFLFPWAFPGYSIPIDVVARAWNDGWNHQKIRYSPIVRDMVQSSIHKYRHLNEWKGRRRRKKRKR